MRWSVNRTSPLLAPTADGGFVFGEKPHGLAFDLCAIIERELESGPDDGALGGQNPATGFVATTSDGARHIDAGERLGERENACAAFAQGLAGEGDVRFLRPRMWVNSKTGRALDAALAEVGTVTDIEEALGENVLVVDDYAIFAQVGKDRDRLCANGQAASLAFGLAPHIVRRMVVLADADEVWQSGYDDFARAIAISACENALLLGIARQTPFVLGGGTLPIFPALPSAAQRLGSELQKQLQEGDEKLDRLALLLDQKRAALMEKARYLWSVEARCGFPKLDKPHEWFSRQQKLQAFFPAGETVPSLGADYQGDLGRFLAEEGHGISPLAPRWFSPRAKTKVAITAAPIAPTVERAPEVVAQQEPREVAPAGSLTLARLQNPRLIQLSKVPHMDSLGVVVDGKEQSEPERFIEALFSDAGALLRVGRDVPSGSVVVVHYSAAGDDT